MPAKNRFTKEQIIDAALSLVREKGSSALSARTLAKRLGASPQPIFSYFDSMESLREAVVDAAKEIYAERVKVGLSQTPAFKGAGEQYILFAKEEPELFQLLFMTENKYAENFQDVFSILGKTAKACIDIIERDYKLEPDRAMLLFEHAWIHSFGICVMCAMGTCRFTDEEISQMLSDNFMGMMMLTKSDFANQNAITPQRKITE